MSLSVSKKKDIVMIFWIHDNFTSKMTSYKIIFLQVYLFVCFEIFLVMKGSKSRIMIGITAMTILSILLSSLYGISSYSLLTIWRDPFWHYYLENMWHTIPRPACIVLVWMTFIVIPDAASLDLVYSWSFYFFFLQSSNRLESLSARKDSMWKKKWLRSFFIHDYSEMFWWMIENWHISQRDSSWPIGMWPRLKKIHLPSELELRILDSFYIILDCLAVVVYDSFTLIF